MQKISHYLENVKNFLNKNYYKIVVVIAGFYLVKHLFLVLQIFFTNNVTYNTDFARDMLLMDELYAKGYILAGPRSSAIGGLFHGPLWTYVNYPIYLLFKFNTVAIGHFWVILYLVFLVFSFFVSYKISKNKFVAFLTMGFCAVSAFNQTLYMINPSGALIIIPIFIYSLYKSSFSKSFLWAIATVVLLAAINQFQVAVGIPLCVTTVIIWLYTSYKDKFYLRLFALLLLPLGFATHILFDLRHNFSQTKAIIYQLTGKDVYRVRFEPIDIFINRVELAFSQGVLLFTDKYAKLNALILFLACATYFAFKNKKPAVEQDLRNFKIVNFLVFVYFSFWFFSQLHQGFMQDFYYNPIIFVQLFCLAILVNYFSKILALIAIAYVFIFGYRVNYNTFFNFKNYELKQDISSWQFYNSLQKDIYSNSPKEFGYFIYAPDILAYQAKWAMRYGQINNPQKNVLRYKKAATTFLVIEPPPKDKPQFVPTSWKQDKVKISGILKKSWCYQNGYCVEKYQLSTDDLKVQSDPNIDDWLFYR